MFPYQPDIQVTYCKSQKISQTAGPIVAQLLEQVQRMFNSVRQGGKGESHNISGEIFLIFTTKFWLRTPPMQQELIKDNNLTDRQNDLYGSLKRK